jgi:hypothetical protein
MQLWIAGKCQTSGPELWYVVVVLAMPSDCWISTSPHVYADTVYHRIDLPHMMKIHNVFHVNLLTPYHETDAYGEAYSQPPPELFDGQQEYEVEKIINDRLHRCKKQYLV